MPIPDYQTFMLPLLKMAGDGATYNFADACEALAKQFNITETELAEMLPSGRYPVFRSRVSWAKTYLTKAALLEIPQRSAFRATKRGLDFLQSGAMSLKTSDLMRYPEFVAFQKGGNDNKSENLVSPTTLPPTVDEEKTPDELIEFAADKLRKSLIQELTDTVKSMSPRFFEELVVKLLVAMGYGGSIKDAAQVVGKSGDGGIDGIIKEDRLGLDNIYIQAKKGTIKSPFPVRRYKNLLVRCKGYRLIKVSS